MRKLPQARSADIVQQKLGGEILIYDLRTHTAFNLNETSSVIYLACDGVTTFEDLQREYNFSERVIRLALDQLGAKNLLKDYSPNDFDEISRRDVLRALGTMVTLPLTRSIVAPNSA